MAFWLSWLLGFFSSALFWGASRLLGLVGFYPFLAAGAGLSWLLRIVFASELHLFANAAGVWGRGWRLHPASGVNLGQHT